MSAETIWRGEASPPAELADEIAGAPSAVLRLHGVEALEIVQITCSAENRDLIVRALRAFNRSDLD